MDKAEMLAGLLRLANTDRPDSNTLALRVATEIAESGLVAARSWLAGYWHGTGVRDHARVVEVRDLIGAGDNLVLARLKGKKTSAVLLDLAKDSGNEYLIGLVAEAGPAIDAARGDA